MSSRAKRICVENTRQLRSQDTRIGKLPDNVLEEVFSYLTAQELKSAALVCKNWDNVIGSAAKTMKKFKIVIDDAKFAAPFRSTRKHQNIELRETIGHASSIKDKIILSQAKTFQLKGQDLTDDVLLGVTQTLELMPLLEDLTIVGRSVGPRKHCYAQVDLPKLKKIKLEGIDPFILQFLKASNLTKVDLQSLTYHFTQTPSPSKGELVTGFVMKCKKLDGVLMDTSDAEHFLKSNWKDCGFKLSYFHLNHSFIDDETSFIDNLKSFFMSQALTLTDFHFDNDYDVSQDLKDGVYSNLKYLPNLEWLTFGRFDSISDLARFNPKLTYLKAYTIGTSLEAGLKMEHLEHLEHLVANVSNADAWKSIIESSPNRLHFVCTFALLDGSGNISVLLQHPKVKHLELICYYPSSFRQIFDLISSNYGNLKSLKLTSFKNTMEFVFPDDPTEWNASEQKARFEEEMLALYPLIPRYYAFPI